MNKKRKRKGKQRRKAPQGRDKEVVICHIFFVVYLGSWRWQKCKQSVTNEHKQSKIPLSNSTTFLIIFQSPIPTHIHTYTLPTHARYHEPPTGVCTYCILSMFVYFVRMSIQSFFLSFFQILCFCFLFFKFLPSSVFLFFQLSDVTSLVIFPK